MTSCAVFLSFLEFFIKGEHFLEVLLELLILVPLLFTGSGPSFGKQTILRVVAPINVWRSAVLFAVPAETLVARRFSVTAARTNIFLKFNFIFV